MKKILLAILLSCVMMGCTKKTEVVVPCDCKPAVKKVVKCDCIESGVCTCIDKNDKLICQCRESK